MSSKEIITIDGPAGSGKSSAADRLAERLSGVCLNSGSLYRIVANELIFRGATTDESSRVIDPDDPVAVMECVDGITIDIANGVAYRIGGRLVEHAALRLPLVDAIVSSVSRHQELRHYINAQLRAYAMTANCDVVCEGRDAGHVIFPDAGYKVYLNAPVEVRAKRLNRSVDEMRLRDHSDMTTKGDGNLKTPREARREGYYVVDGDRPMSDVDEELFFIASGLIDNDY